MANKFNNGSNWSKMKDLFIIIFFLLACSMLISGYLNNQIMQHNAKLQYSFKDNTGTLQQATTEGEVNNYNFSFSHYNPAIVTNNREVLTVSKKQANKLIGKLVQAQVPVFLLEHIRE